MTDAGSGKKGTVDRLGCPVLGDTVTVTAKYKTNEQGDDTLAFFACDQEGQCGIPDWDPCPLYVSYREKKAGKKHE